MDIGLLYALVEFIGLHYLLSATVALIIATGVNYLLNKTWSFGSTCPTSTALPRYLMLFCANYLATMLALYVFVDHLKFQYIVVKIGIMGAITLWNYFLYRGYVYKTPQTPCGEEDGDCFGENSARRGFTTRGGYKGSRE